MDTYLDCYRSDNYCWDYVDQTMKLVIYTDGACSGNPGPGGWAAIGFDKNYMYVDPTIEIFRISGYQSLTTNNRMELIAIGRALQESIKIEQTNHPPVNLDEIVIVSDSQNAIKWLTREYQRRDPTIKNLGKEIDKLISTIECSIRFEHVKGHSGHPINDELDKLAKEALQRGVRHRTNQSMNFS